MEGFWESGQLQGKSKTKFLDGTIDFDFWELGDMPGQVKVTGSNGARPATWPWQGSQPWW